MIRRQLHETRWIPLPNDATLAPAIEIAHERIRGLIETWASRGALDGYHLENLVASAYMQGVYDMAATREEPVVGTGF